ncbi:MAG: hypothetical protein ACE5FN_04895 [Leptospirillia bacterium]
MKEIKVKCLGCGSLEGGDFCGGCHTVLPIEGQEIDYFRTFGMSPRPAVDRESLKASFLALSQKFHPDRNMMADAQTREHALLLSSQLNHAYAALCNTKERLRYLVGRETDREPTEAKQVPAEMMELFFEVHDLMSEVDDYLARKKPAASRIVAAVAMTDEGKSDLLNRIAALLQRGARKEAAVEAEVADLDSLWDDETKREGILSRLTELADMLAYLERLKNSLNQKKLALKQ